jgi:hypothetical protein
MFREELSVKEINGLPTAAKHKRAERLIEKFRPYFVTAPCEFYELHYGEMKLMIDTFSYMSSEWYENHSYLHPCVPFTEMQIRVRKLANMPLVPPTSIYPRQPGFFLQKVQLPDCPRPKEELWILDI